MKIAILVIAGISFYCFYVYAQKVKHKHCLATQISSRIFDFNSFELKVSGNINLGDFKIINQNSGKTIYENGSHRKGIKNDYGYCIFDLFYKGEKLYEIGHFKTNNWYTYDYVMLAKKVNDSLVIDLYSKNNGNKLYGLYKKNTPMK